MQLKSLVQFANYRFEVYDCLVTGYIGLQRWRDAHHLIAEASKLLGKTPRMYVVSVPDQPLSKCAMFSKGKFNFYFFLCFSADSPSIFSRSNDETESKTVFRKGTKVQQI